jgi:hypothetical protein
VDLRWRWYGGRDRRRGQRLAVGALLVRVMDRYASLKVTAYPPFVLDVV